VKKDGLPEIAHKIVEDLKWDFNVTYDEKMQWVVVIEDKMH
jgi:glycyl-tRNA synthetase